MIFLDTFLTSIKLPNKQALFKLNRTGMDIVVIYMFLLICVTSIPTFIDQINNPNEISEQTHFFFILIFFFIFHVLPMTVIVFLAISLLAYIFLGVTKLMQRKLRFQILWKMIAYTTTVPFTIYTVFALFFSFSNVFLLLSLLYTVILLLKMISIYPRRKTT
ncbi:MAG TPA: DUF1189 family protein [Bacillota bacterium]|nr:DUF1189 family protein [Bacillota bacterium]